MPSNSCGKNCGQPNTPQLFRCGAASVIVTPLALFVADAVALPNYKNSSAMASNPRRQHLAYSGSSGVASDPILIATSSASGWM